MNTHATDCGLLREHKPVGTFALEFHLEDPTPLKFSLKLCFLKYVQVVHTFKIMLETCLETQSTINSDYLSSGNDNRCQ